MNERIKELAEQANKRIRYKIDPYTFGEIDDPDGTFTRVEFDKEKFAELIVRECMELTRWKDFDMSVEQRIRLSVYQDIKEHFGVEE